ncbi:PREDICTED: endothelial cell-specific chemotaxis regulator isoform X2 [Corvus brachyrhynchos]|uniref:endothelial cell-specific chemotaxis regulator isoform X2 n=1 Tax=Corvus brachyrhynchos TaxID=85066 RepID=UPI0008165BBD|nr:PREDICTED: endothelial cell-specific chemotaxis regulator isoform X2 [Corvus brachyrhynchos]
MCGEWDLGAHPTPRKPPPKNPSSTRKPLRPRAGHPSVPGAESPAKLGEVSSAAGSRVRVSPGGRIAARGPSRDGQRLREPQASAEMLLPSIHPFLWLLLLLPGPTASTNSSSPAGTGQSQPIEHSPEVKNHSSEPSVKSTPVTTLNLTSVGQTTTPKPSPITTTTLTATTERDDKSSGNRSTAAPSPTPQGQDPVRNESTTTSVTQGTSEPVTPTPNHSSHLPQPSPTDEKSPLTVAAFGVISFVVILIVVVIILVSVVSLRFKCNHSKDPEDKQKPGTSMVSESCSADTSQKGNSITLISMKNINTNNSMSYPPSEKVSLFSLAY